MTQERTRCVFVDSLPAGKGSPMPNRRWLCSRSVVDNPDYHVFGQYGMNKRRQRKLFISQINKPRAVKNIVFVVAGQDFRVRPFRNGLSSGVTGQLAGHAEGFGRRTGWRYVRVTSNSLLHRIMQSGYFSLRDTFVGAVFDARFNYKFSKRDKNRIENGYYHYLLQRLGGSKPRTIYIAGHSRGGCLALRLASRLTARFPSARIIVHNYDGVCMIPGLLQSSEFGVRRRPLRFNPRNRNYLVYHSNFYRHFRRRRCLAIQSFLSGEAVLGLRRIRSFGHLGFTSSRSITNRLLTSKGFNWYIEKFSSLGHVRIAGAYHYSARSHLAYAMKSMPCSCWY